MSSINFKLLNPDVEFSKEQKDIFEAVKNSKSHVSINATAGSGKTTTILNALKLIPRFRKTIFLSFSNAIVDTLKSRVPQGVQATTLHSLGNRFVTQYYPGLRVNPNKYYQLALNLFGTKSKENIKKAFQIQDVSAFVRMTLTPLEPAEIEKMCDKYDVNYDNEVIDKVIELIQADEYPSSIDFADMLFLPAMNDGMILEQFDYVFLDEAQDCNAAQIKFVEYLLKPGVGRLIAVGDEEQAIYSFSGSDAQAFQYLLNRPNTKNLPLPTTYRCGSRIVEEARKYSKKIQSRKNAHKGVVRNGFFHEIEEGDLIIARNNAPLVDAYFRLIEDDKRAKIYGKDIEKGLVSLAEKCMAKQKDTFSDNLYEELDKVVDELVRKGIKHPDKHLKYGNLSDKIDLLEIILTKVNSTSEIIPLLKTMFVENDTPGVKLMTCHRSKGLENSRVFIMTHYKNKQLIPSQYATQKWQLEQERNLMFVAVTRAIDELVYFSLEGGSTGEGNPSEDDFWDEL